MSPMNKKPTQAMKTLVKPKPQLAAGLHYPAKARTYFFDTILFDDRPKLYISIGRSAKSDICLQDDTVTLCHAILTRTAQGYFITDGESTNGMYINGQYNRGPVDVIMGMEIRLGDALLFSVDRNGLALLCGRIVTLSDYCREVVRVYGGTSKAAQHLGNRPSREFYRRHQ